VNDIYDSHIASWIKKVSAPVGNYKGYSVVNSTDYNPKAADA
jgi:hypothetical protein